MSQDSLMRVSHQTDVQGSSLTKVAGTGSSPRAADPAARSGKRVYNALNASSVGLELGIAVAIGIAVGIYMDRWLGTAPWMLLLWMLLGLVAGFRGMFRAVARADRAAAEEAAESGDSLKEAR
jgi:ATP synthase protein I